MSDKKQTAVEWLIARFESGDMYNVEDAQFIKHQAIKMEKEQIMDSQMDMFNHINQNKFGLDYLNKRDAAEEYAEQYYKETYEN